MHKTSAIFLVVPPGFEEVCISETRTLGLAATRQGEGGVTFPGGLRELYLANLHLRTPSRILVRIGEVRARDFPEFYHRAVRLPWGSFLRPGTPVKIRAASHRSRLGHTGRIAETAAAAITQALGGIPSDRSLPEQTILARFEDDQCLFSADSSGELLHRRGGRPECGAAPLRENLAAACLLTVGWDGSLPLHDPLCGSGTIPLEAALIATHRPPGRHRDFAFMHWPGFRPGLWQALCVEADRRLVPPAAPISGTDAAPAVIAAARTNAERSGVAAYIDLNSSPLQHLPPRPGPGLVFINPPYGVRLAAGADLTALYAELGAQLQRAFPGWTIALLAPEPRLAAATRLPLRRLTEFRNGGIPVGLYVTN